MELEEFIKLLDVFGNLPLGTLRKKQARKRVIESIKEFFEV